MGRLVNNSAAVIRLRNSKLNSGLEEMAKQGVEEYKENLSKPFPPASRPGQYPRRRTGKLHDNVDVALDPGSLRSWFGVKKAAPYIKHLLASGRLGPERVVITKRAKLRAAFRRGVKRATS